mmetsp:Transcript_527/g.1326  ORF Transcript_527/g.1326 Transcript_527/m.1326 type:complete len:191 (-) Transcript_527:126-698(-)
MRRLLSYRTTLVRNPSQRESVRHGIKDHQLRYKVTTSRAKSMLGFAIDSKPTVIQLRQAYYEAAKLCHPDVKDDGHKLDFRDLKDAFEHLMKGGHVTDDPSDEISLDEEQEYRRACIDVLGLKAEIVEESKQNPMFLHWLSGRTDGAQYWRNFFTAHGGLAQKLRPPAGYLAANENQVVKASETRRRRRR